MRKDTESPERRGVSLVGALLLGTVCASGAGAEQATPPGSPGTSAGELTLPATVSPPMSGPLLPPEPAAGLGRLSLVFGGNRRWCTFPDDRVIKPPDRLSGGKGGRDEVYVFGYKFVVSAVKRGAPDVPLMLFESPLYQTAAWRPAVKLGRGAPQAVPGPRILSEEEATHPTPRGPAASTLIPFWMEQQRCTTVPERFDFDLEAGTYDVYIAFDLLMRQKTWVHRMADYLTDIPVEAARSTRLEGLVNLGAGSEREVTLLHASLQPASEAHGAGGP